MRMDRQPQIILDRIRQLIQKISTQQADQVVSHRHFRVTWRRQMTDRMQLEEKAVIGQL